MAILHVKFVWLSVASITWGSLFYPEKCLKEFIPTWWACSENPILVHSIFSSKFMITCFNPMLVHFSIARISDFGPGSYFESKLTKIGFSKQAHHVRRNSFKHFSGSKKELPRTTFIYWNWKLNSTDRVVKRCTFHVSNIQCLVHSCFQYLVHSSKQKYFDYMIAIYRKPTLCFQSQKSVSNLPFLLHIYIFRF